MKRGDIYLVDLPFSSAGHEQGGNRPALIVHNDETSKILSVIMIIPFTSKLSAQRFQHTMVIQPTKENGLNQISILLINQLRAIDRKRITNKIGSLDPVTMAQVNNAMKQLLGL